MVDDPERAGRHILHDQLRLDDRCELATGGTLEVGPDLEGHRRSRLADRPAVGECYRRRHAWRQEARRVLRGPAALEEDDGHECDDADATDERGHPEEGRSPARWGGCPSRGRNGPAFGRSASAAAWRLLCVGRGVGRGAQRRAPVVLVGVDGRVPPEPPPRPDPSIDGPAGPPRGPSVPTRRAVRPHVHLAGSVETQSHLW